MQHYITGGRDDVYRAIFRHNTRRGEPFKTGGRANVLWMDNHVSSIEEEDIRDKHLGQIKWYDPMYPNPASRWKNDWDG